MADRRELPDLPLAELHRRFDDGRATPTELLAQCRSRAAILDPRLEAYRCRNDEAEDQAHAARGRPETALQGLVVGIKDVFGARGMDTYGGTAKRWPEKWSSEGPLIRALRRRRSVLSGKIHSVEFAFGLVGTNRHWPTPINPWSRHDSYVPGGSTSGGGVAVATGVASIVVGSDAGGSIRVPAALTGTVGLKLSGKRWTDTGRPPLCPTQDRLGFIARTVADLALAMGALAQPEFPGGSGGGADGLWGLRIGLPENRFWDDGAGDVAKEVERAVRELEAQGAIVRRVELPDADEVEELRTLGGVAAAECLDCVLREFPEWMESLDPHIRSRLTQFGTLPLAELGRRRDRIARARANMRAAFRDIADVLITPSVAIATPTMAAVSTADGYRSANEALGRNSYPFNIWDLPALSMPAALDRNGMPIGMQVIGAPGAEDDLLRHAAAIEHVLGPGSARCGPPPMLPRP